MYNNKISSAQYVNTITGAIADIDSPNIHGGGKTHPAAARPAGMVQLGPDTITGGDNGPGYSYHHTTIEGFSFNRLSGIGAYGDLGNLQVMPITGPVSFHSGSNEHDLYQSDDEGWRSAFSHDSEVTQAGYYSVMLDTYGIQAEATCTERAGILRFTYPESGDAKVLIDLARRIGGRSVRQYVKVTGPDTVEGWIYCDRTGGGFLHGANENKYRLHFYGQFSEPWTSFGLWNLGEDRGAVSEAEDEDLGFYASFSSLNGNRRLMFKAGISYVSVEGARRNLEQELGHWDFDLVRAQSSEAWAATLDNCLIEEADDARKEVFYSALYHVMLDPRIAYDADGQYSGANGTVGRIDGFRYRTVFSGWDVFRSAFPLLTILHPDIINDEINSLLQLARDSGQTFCRWEMMGNDVNCMIGDPGLAITAEAYVKGIRGYDAEEAWSLFERTAFGPNSTRIGMEDMNRLGYVPEQISATLENVYADWCIHRVALAMGYDQTAELFKQRALNYRSVYDPGVGWMRRKNSEGEWMEWDDKYDLRGCVESNVFQQNWFVPHDVAGLIQLMGLERFRSELDELFAKADLSALWNDDYNHSNEPCHHAAHLFVYAGQPWKTQYWVRRIQKEAYRTGPYGYCGNEDVGQMSAWYIMTAAGFHPVCPVDGVYIVNTPLFRSMTIKLDPRYHSCAVSDKLVIETDLSPEDHVYIRGIELNGVAIERAWLTHEEITAGGKLVYRLAASPDTAWGVSAPPPSLSAT